MTNPDPKAAPEHYGAACRDGRCNRCNLAAKDATIAAQAKEIERLKATEEELREYIRRRQRSGRWGEEKGRLKAQVEELRIKLGLTGGAL